MQARMFAEFLLENWHNLALIFLTAVLSLSTWRLTVETRRLGQIQVEPRVSIRTEWDRDEAYELVISNEGLGVAKDIRFTFEGDSTHFHRTLLSVDAPPLEELHFMKQGIDQLESKQTYRYLIGGYVSDELVSGMKGPWIFGLEYKNLFGKTIKDKQVIEFSLFGGNIPPPNRLKEISTHLGKIHQTLDKRR